MLALTRIKHIGLRISDYETSKSCYQQLGFKPISGPSGPEPVAIMLPLLVSILISFSMRKVTKNTTYSWHLKQN